MLSKASQRGNYIAPFPNYFVFTSVWMERTFFLKIDTGAWRYVISKIKVLIIERFSRPTGTRTCTCRLQVITTRTSSHNFSCLAVETCTCTCKCFKCNSRCYPTYLIIFNSSRKLRIACFKFFEHHCFIYVYFYIPQMNKITARAIACFEGRNTSNKTPITYQILLKNFVCWYQYSH